MFENPRRGRQARNFTTNVPKILDLKSSSEQIFSENCRWVSLSKVESPISDTSVQTIPDCFLFRHEKLSATTTTTTTGSREYVKKAIALDLIQNWYQLQNNNFESASRFFVLSLLSLHDLDVKLPRFHVLLRRWTQTKVFLITGLAGLQCFLSTMHAKRFVATMCGRYFIS